MERRRQKKEKKCCHCLARQGFNISLDEWSEFSRVECIGIDCMAWDIEERLIPEPIYDGGTKIGILDKRVLYAGCSKLPKSTWGEVKK